MCARERPSEARGCADNRNPMIKFFRHIRQRMIKENRVSKYILYAAGEIILVVIGILIAVQFNDWNESRKIRLSNGTQLSKMIVELNTNINRMELLATNSKGLYDYGYPSFSEAVLNCDSLLRLTYIGLTEKDIPFLSSSRFSAGSPRLNLQQDVFEELKSTGRLNTIGSDSLVSAIKNYNKRYLREEYYAQLHSANVYRNLYNIENGLGKLILDHRMDSAHFSLDNYPWYFDHRSKEYQEIQVAFESMWNSQRQTLEKLLIISDLSESLIQQIQAELLVENQ